MTNLKVNLQDFLKIKDLLRKNRRNSFVINLDHCSVCNDSADVVVVYYGFDDLFRFNYELLFLCESCFSAKSRYLKD